MRFYTKQHKYSCGIDLHARSMYVCILDKEWDDAPIEEIIETLALLPQMYEHPAFPFDMKGSFQLLALPIKRFWESTEEARK